MNIDEEEVAQVLAQIKMIYCWRFMFGAGTFGTGKTSEW